MRLVSYFIFYYGFLWGVHMGQESSNYQKRVLTIPNGLSLLRLCMIPLLIWLYCVKENGRMTIWVLALSGLTDMADGYSQTSQSKNRPRKTRALNHIIHLQITISARI